MKHSAVRKHSIDVGLAVMAACMKPGDAPSLSDIAEVCETTPQRIQQIEKQALLRVRRALQRLGETRH